MAANDVSAKESPPPAPRPKNEAFELFLKGVGPLLTATGLLIGVWQFNKQQGFNDAQEFKRKVWEKRLNAYTDIGNLTAQIATHTHDTLAMDSLTNQFEQLYWGKMPLIEEAAVEEAMKKFSEELNDFRNKESDAKRLKKRGYELMKTCQESLHHSWKTLSDED
jgi:hypothetical protein